MNGPNSKVWPTATPAPGKFDNAQTRQRVRRRLRAEVRDELIKRFAGRDRGGSLAWAEGFTRRIRRAIERDKFHRLWREGKHA